MLCGSVCRRHVTGWLIHAFAKEVAFHLPGQILARALVGKVEAVFAWDVQGASASSKLTGELKDNRLEGTYDSTTTDGAAKGKWKVTRAPLAPK